MPRCAVIADLRQGRLHCLVPDGTVQLSAAKCKATDIRQKEYVTLLTRSLNSTTLPEAREGAGVSVDCAVNASAPHAAL